MVKHSARDSANKMLVRFIRRALATVDPTTTLEVGTDRYAARYALVAPHEATGQYEVTEVTDLRELAGFVVGCLPGARA